MPDPQFADPRLAALYDAVEGERADLDAYVALAEEFGAAGVLDLGCGTGVLACRLAASGRAVTAVDPAAASVEIARRRPGAAGVRWIVGDATDLPALQVDLALMTANVAQVFVTDEAWRATLGALAGALRPGGHLVFESRDPDRRAWLEWTPERTRTTVEAAGVGTVEAWCEVTAVDGPLVSFVWTYVVRGEAITSPSTLRFRTRTELAESLAAAGFVLDEVRDAPDRPGRELVHVAHRPAATPGVRG